MTAGLVIRLIVLVLALVALVIGVGVAIRQPKGGKPARPIALTLVVIATGLLLTTGSSLLSDSAGFRIVRGSAAVLGGILAVVGLVLATRYLLTEAGRRRS